MHECQVTSFLTAQEGLVLFLPFFLAKVTNLPDVCTAVAYSLPVRVTDTHRFDTTRKDKSISLLEL